MQIFAYFRSNLSFWTSPPPDILSHLGTDPKLHFLSLLGQVENNFQDIFILYESVMGDASVALFVNYLYCIDCVKFDVRGLIKVNLRRIYPRIQLPTSNLSRQAKSKKTCWSGRGVDHYTKN